MAVAFPVTGILSLMMDLSNEVDMPDGWMEQPDAKWKRLLLGGFDPVRGWNWNYKATKPRELRKLALERRRPVNAAYMWMLMNGDTPLVLLVIQYWGVLWDFLCGKKDDEEEEEEDKGEGEGGGKKGKNGSLDSAARAGGNARGESSSEEEEEDEEDEADNEDADEELEEAKAGARKSRRLAFCAVVGVWVTWTIMTWRAPLRAPLAPHAPPVARSAFGARPRAPGSAPWRASAGAFVAEGGNREACLFRHTGSSWSMECRSTH